MEKSTYQTGRPPAGTVRTYVMTATGPDRFESKETGNPIADTNRFYIVNERSYEFVERKNGVEVITITVEISPDGKTRTSKQQGKGPDGKPTLNVAVWDRQ